MFTRCYRYRRILYKAYSFGKKKVAISKELKLPNKFLKFLNGKKEVIVSGHVDRIEINKTTDLSVQPINHDEMIAELEEIEKEIELLKEIRASEDKKVQE